MPPAPPSPLRPTPRGTVYIFCEFKLLFLISVFRHGDYLFLDLMNMQYFISVLEMKRSISKLCLSIHLAAFNPPPPFWAQRTWLSQYVCIARAGHELSLPPNIHSPPPMICDPNPPTNSTQPNPNQPQHWTNETTPATYATATHQTDSRCFPGWALSLSCSWISMGTGDRLGEYVARWRW